jgi:hypothetical protein
MTAGRQRFSRLVRVSTIVILQAMTDVAFLYITHGALCATARVVRVNAVSVNDEKGE